MPNEENSKNVIKSILAWWDFAIVSGVTAVIAWVGFKFWINAPDSSDRLAIATTVATLIVAWFAIVSSLHSRRQANISKRALDVSYSALEAARLAEHNAQMPIMKFSRRSGADNKRNLDLCCKNVGGGPALNVECRLVAPGAEAQADPRKINDTALGVAEELDLDFSRGVQGDDNPPVTAPALDILIEYDDMFGTRFCYKMPVDENKFPFFDQYVPQLVKCVPNGAV